MENFVLLDSISISIGINISIGISVGIYPGREQREAGFPSKLLSQPHRVTGAPFPVSLGASQGISGIYSLALLSGSCWN